MQSDTLRMAFTYIIAMIVIVGGGILLIVPSQVPPEQLLPFETGILGVVIGFVFNREAANGASRATERAFQAGAASQPTTTLTAGPPASATSTPPPAATEEG